MEFFQTYGTTILMVVGLVVVFYLMYRSNKKQEKEAQNMRDSLEVGDEITTIGGIVGEIVKVKEETITIETGKDRTKIKLRRSAVRSVDVYAAEKRGETKKTDSIKSDKPALKEDKKASKNENEENAENE
ncbi:MAG: preprotein translocase subunit YajC [Clostridia bacterium]|nr:preprotein translocase subunit YajC [Clostridia bacterium]